MRARDEGGWHKNPFLIFLGSKRPGYLCYPPIFSFAPLSESCNSHLFPKPLHRLGREPTEHH